MSFSFRSMFQGTTEPGSQVGVGLPDAPLQAGLEAQSPFSSAMSVTAPPLNAASPFGAPLFKTAAGENHTAAPVQHSAFSFSSAPGTGSPLTVADVLPQLPPEVARAGALPPEQPVAISAQVLDEALRGGQAALPIFEIYRVCPALFQTPISPQDPRMIPLPASKLPRLIAATQPGASDRQNSPAMPAASPFGMAAAPGGMTSEAPAFGAPPTSNSGMSLPPKRQGPPPALADIPNREAAPQLSLPGQMPPSMAPAFPMSPFAAAGAELANTAALKTSPFSAAPASMPQATPSSVFAHGAAEPAPQTPPASPFSAAPSNAAASPFGAIPSQAAPASVESPFGSLFGSKAVLTGQPAPDAAPQRPAVPAFPSSQPSAQPSTSSPQLRVPLAALLKGYTMAELGFDPMVVPGWITTTLSTKSVQEMLSSPTPLSELGLLIDGITDVGFRNVLNTAKREFQLRLPADELQNALAGGAPPTLPNLASLGIPPALTPAAPASPFGAQGGMMRIEPPSSPAQPTPLFSGQPSPFAADSNSVPGTNSPYLAPPAAAPSAAPTSPFGTISQAPAIPAATFLSSPQPPVQSNPPPAPLFQPQAPAASPFGMPATALQPPTPKAQDPFSAPAQPFAFPAAAATAPQPQAAAQSFFTPPAPPSAFSAPPQAPAFAPAATFASAPQQFEPAPAPPAPTLTQPPAQMADTTVLPPERPQEAAQPFNSGFSFTPAANTPNDGFSSDQLFGKQPVSEASNWNTAVSAAFEAERPAERVPSGPVIDLPATPVSFFEPEEKAAPPPLNKPFLPPRHEAPAPEPKSVSAASIKAPRSPSVRSAASTSNLGVHMHDTDPDQILLRALLDTDSDLTPQKVVEMACALPGIAACVCIQGDRSISHIGAHKPQAREFQRQATDLAQHLRTLAPLIGIEGAETFTMNSGDRLMTFCFPEGAILGVLHDAEPTLGLRDKITLIARELSRMIA